MLRAIVGESVRMNLPFTDDENVGRYEKLRAYYTSEAVRVCMQYDPCVVLKTDSFNEAMNLDPIVPLLAPICEHVYCIEYDLPTLVRASYNCRNITNAHFDDGDIREAQGHGSFDVIVDASTLDHILPIDVPRTLEAYNYALSEGGTLLLFVWVTERETHTNSDVWAPTIQCEFNRAWLEEELRKQFTIVEDACCVKEGKKALWKYVCKRND